MKKEDTLLVSYSCQTIEDNAVLIIGRKRLNESVEIINAFQGNDAVKLYKKLLEKKL